LPFFAETSLAYAERLLRKGDDAETALVAAAKVWAGNQFVAGEADDAYNRLAFRDRDPLGVRFAELAERVYAPLFAAQVEGGA
ncbi:MAG: hypothetical protein P8011_15905, partial [Acidihalobacter sp.]|uniref:hypothetical protein n=1 Tax=Acidihalobacter sp. TaxID=1872108 RepID=UPI00307E7CAC